MQSLNEKDISDSLIRWLEPYGPIKWHKNSNHSFYIKFRDVRLGSIRIANHQGRERYQYSYEIFSHDKDIERKIHDIVEAIAKKSQTIVGFDPEKYVVWDKKNRGYKTVPTYSDYKNAVFAV